MNQPIEVQKILDALTLNGGQLFIGAYGDDPVANPISILTSSTETDVGYQLATPLDLDHNGYTVNPVDGVTFQPYINTSYSIVLRDISGGVAYGPVQVPYYSESTVYTLATLPTVVEGGTIYVSDATGASVTGSQCFGNATNWIDVTTGIAVV